MILLIRLPQTCMCIHTSKITMKAKLVQQVDKYSKNDKPVLFDTNSSGETFSKIYNCQKILHDTTFN